MEQATAMEYRERALPAKRFGARTRVLTVNDARARGREGIPLTTQAFQLWQVRDGRIVRVRVFASEAEALGAVGLADGDESQGLWTIGLLCARVVVGAGDDELKRRVRDCGLAALLAAWRLLRCASRCRARTACGWFGLPVGDEPAVGRLHLLGELGLAVAILLGLVHAWARIAPAARAFRGF